MRAGLLWVLCGCGGEVVGSGAASEVGDRRAVVIGVDGLRPDALAIADAPNLRRLMDEGGSTWTATTQLEVPPVSGPGWATLLTGVDPSAHLVSGNNDLGDRSVAWPTIPQRVRESGRPVSLVINWLGVLALSSSLAYDELVIGDDVAVGVDAEARVNAGDALVWTHFNDVDSAGHATGFTPDNPGYVAEIEDVDAQIGPALAAVAARPASERWLVVLVTDHAGEGTSHDQEIPSVQTIPAAIWHDGIAHVDLGAVHQRDLAPTLLAWFGLSDPALPGEPWL